MITEKDKSLQESLRYAGVTELPAAATDSNWMNAIVLVRRITGDHNYCVAKNENGNARIIRSFGSIGMVSEIEAIYPYASLNPNFVFKSEDDDAILTHLTNYGYSYDEVSALLSTEGKTEGQIKADRGTIKLYIDEVAYKLSKAEESEKERAVEASEKANNYSKRISNGKTRKKRQS